MPFTLVFDAFAVVKSGMSGEDMVHDFMPVVIQPMADVSPGTTDCGLATTTIDCFEICTLHSAPAVIFFFVCASSPSQVNPYVATFASSLGETRVAFAEPESLPPVEKPSPLLDFELAHEYEIAIVIPTSAISG